MFYFWFFSLLLWNTHLESAYSVVLSQFCRISKSTSSVKSSNLNMPSSSSACAINRLADTFESGAPDARRFLLWLSFFIRPFSSVDDVDGWMSLFISFIGNAHKVDARISTAYKIITLTKERKKWNEFMKTWDRNYCTELIAQIHTHIQRETKPLKVINQSQLLNILCISTAKQFNLISWNAQFFFRANKWLEFDTNRW